MSQLYFGSLPETYALAGATLALTYLLSIHDLDTGRIRLPAWWIAGLLTFAILITNFAQTAIAYSGVVVARTPRGKWLALLLGFLIPILAVAVALSLLQLWLFPTSKLFFDLATVTRQSEYIKLAEIMAQPYATLREVLQNTLVINLAGIEPLAITQGNNPDVRFTFYGAPLQVGVSGVVSLLLWLVLFLENLYRNVAERRTRAYAAIMGLILSFNLLLYVLYNISELFLYSVTITLLVVLLGFHAKSVESRFRLGMWWAAAGLLAINNMVVLQRFLALLRHL